VAQVTTVITVTMNTAIDRVLSSPGFTVGRHQLAESVSLTPAGKGINLSRALARLGRSNVATGFVGKAEAGRFEKLLRAGEGLARVNDQLLSVPGPTRENITVIDPDAGTDTHLRTKGYPLDDHDLARLSTKLGLLSREDSVFVFAGSTPQGVDQRVVSNLVQTAQQGGAQVVLDSDGDLLAAVLGSIDQPVWMVSPNRAELASAVGKDLGRSFEEVLDAANSLTDRSQWVLVSLGGEGGLLITPSGAWRGVCEIDPAQVVSTVGSGDCLVAAAVDARLHGMSPEDVLRRALAVATASTLIANPADFDLKEVDRLKESTKVRQA